MRRLVGKVLLWFTAPVEAELEAVKAAELRRFLREVDERLSPLNPRPVEGGGISQ